MGLFTKSFDIKKHSNDGAVIDVSHFGAKGDGVTDDTLAIQTAINNANGKAVLFSAGTYKISSQLNARPTTKIIGSGRSLTKLKANTSFSGSNLINVGYDYCSISNLGIDCNNVPNLTGVYVNPSASVAGFDIENVTIFNVEKGSPWNNSGLYLKGYNFNIENVEIVGDAIWGIQMDGASDVKMTNFLCVGHVNSMGVFGCEQILCSNVQLDSFTGSGLITDATHNALFDNFVIFYNATVYGASGSLNGIKIGSSGTYTTNLPSDLKFNNISIRNLGDGTSNSIAIELLACENLSMNSISISNTSNTYTSGGQIGVGIKYNNGTNILNGRISNIVFTNIPTRISGNKPLDILFNLSEEENKVSVTSYGAIGDYNSTSKTGTDNATAITNAINQCISLKNQGITPTLYFPHSKGFVANSAISIPNGINVIMDSKLYYVGTSNIVLLSIGDINVGGTPSLTHKINIERATQSDWTDEACIGVKLINQDTSSITIINANKFTIGIQMLAHTKGTAYNNVFLGYIVSNKIGLDLTNYNNGWVNENAFYGGRFNQFTTTNRGKHRYGIRITSQDALYKNNNNNAFFKPSMELNIADANIGYSGIEGIPVLIEHGMQNAFYSARNDGSSDTFARLLNGSNENYIEIGYSNNTNTIDDQSTSPSTYYVTRRTMVDKFLSNPIFVSGALHKTATAYSSNSVNIPNVHIGENATANYYKSYSNITMYDNYLEIGSSRGVGVFVDTHINKRFVVKRDVEVGNGGRILIRCYDSAGNILTDDGSNKQHVKTRIPYTLTYYSGYGGGYRTGSDGEYELYFSVSSTTAKVAVLIVYGSAAVRIRGFSIHSVDGGYPSVTTGFEDFNNIAYSSGIPTNGKFNRGRVVYNENPSSAGYVGWVCTTSGTANGTAWVATTAYTVGQLINANSKVYQCTVAGTSSSTSPTHTSGTAADGTVTWQYIDVLAVLKTFGLIS